MNKAWEIRVNGRLVETVKFDREKAIRRWREIQEQELAAHKTETDPVQKNRILATVTSTARDLTPQKMAEVRPLQGLGPPKPVKRAPTFMFTTDPAAAGEVVAVV